MRSDLLGNLHKRFKDPSWTLSGWLTTTVMVAGWGSILLMGVTDPLGGINTLYPLFGISNQLLAAIALTVIAAIVLLVVVLAIYRSFQTLSTKKFTTTEDPFVESKMFAAAGFIPTKAEREFWRDLTDEQDRNPHNPLLLTDANRLAA